MATVTQGPRGLVTRSRLAALAVVAGVLATYGFFAIHLQPLGAGTDEALYRAPGQTILTDSSPSTVAGVDGRAPLLLLSYVDGGEATMAKTLYNDGPTPLTITGVQTSPSYWLGLVTLKDARPAAVAGPPPCSLEAVERGAALLRSCQLNEAATWSGGDFRPIEVSPGKQGVVALRMLMSNCEDTGPGGYLIIDSIQVHYSVLGFPHIQAVDVGPYWFQSPATCPRSGAARP